LGAFLPQLLIELLHCAEIQFRIYHRGQIWEKGMQDEQQQQQSERPIAPLIFLCYFFPLVIMLIVTTACEVATGFALGAALAAGCALVLYVILKRWEHAIEKQISSISQVAGVKKEEIASPITSPSFDSFLQEKELWQKERERYEASALDREAIIKELLKERDILMMEKKLLLDQKEGEVNQLTDQIRNQERESHRLQELLQDGNEEIREKEQLIEKLKFEIENLNFELKTLLKLERRSTPAPSSSTSLF
jgi:hypothetical protein